MDEPLNNIEINYDPKNDVMYCSFGKPTDAISVERSEGVFARLDPETNKVVGLTIVNFLRRFEQHPGENVSLSLAAVPVGAIASH
jgi:hypothetical protein